MALAKRYEGGFNSLGDIAYRFEIWQEGFAGNPTEIAVTDDPLTIEWAETDKLEPVHSSSAKLQLYSDSDRQFVDLYTIKAGNVRLDIYREGSLYWSGTLDPELYEEPFAYKTDYGVELTFSDFAILDRSNFSDTGFKTLRELIQGAITASGINCGPLNEYISTKIFENSSSNLLDAISVQCQNFYDEDGEAMTMREVLDEMLRPFTLRLIQKDGAAHLYDLNALYTAFEPEPIEWDSDDSTLSVDSVYNDVTVTYSPYEKVSLMKGTVDPKSVNGQRLTTWFSTDVGDSAEVGFYTYLSDSGKGLEKNAQAKFYRIDPEYSGSEEAGVAWTVETFSSMNSGNWVSHVQQPSQNIGDMLLKVPNTPYLTNIGDSIRDNYRLRVSLQLLFDPRYNPFESSSVKNEEGNWEEQQDRANFAYVPIKLTLWDDSGTALYHYENYLVKDSNSFANPGEKALWRYGEASWGDAWLCWYQGNRKDESGLGGWQSNKQIIGYYRDELPELFDKYGNGELINLPPVGGYLELQVGTGIPIYDYGREIKQGNYDQCRWLLYKEPAIEFVERTGNSISTKDIEISAWLNRDAKGGLNIDTVLGTMPEPSPAALGQLFDTVNYAVRNSFYRAGTTDLLEKLLIGTVYTQYAMPHKMLSGTTVLLPEFKTYTDTNEPGTYLILMERQDVLNEQSEVKMVQFEADDYEGIEYNEE